MRMILSCRCMHASEVVKDFYLHVLVNNLIFQQMKNRNLVSLSVTFGFLAIAITGILMYFGERGGITTVHVIFGLLFVAAAIFHVVNNWNSLKLYTRDKKIGRIRKEFILVSIILLFVLIGSAVNLGPFSAVARAGEELGREESGEREEGHFSRNNSFENINTNETFNGTELQFIIQKSNEAAAPLMAIWVTDSTGRFVENLFVPARVNLVSEKSENKHREHFEGKMQTVDLKPELLTEWFAFTGGIKPNFEGATPAGNFFLNTKTTAAKKFSVLLEVYNNGVKEIYRANVDLTKGSIYQLTSVDGKLLARAIFEVKK
jgi:hypothetical protein